MGARKYVDRTVDVTNFRQVRNAAMSLKVTEEQLKEAVLVVGNKIDDLTVHFKAFHNPYLRRVSGGRWRL